MPQPDTPNLDDIKRRLREATSELWRELQPHLHSIFASDCYPSDRFPDRLCHYTDFQGFKGIIEKHALWATHTRSLNDRTEEKHGTEIVNAHLSACALDLSSPFDIVLGASPNFATCFCEDAHLLSMWRGYASHGGGYCLEFDLRNLSNCFFPPFDRKFLIKMRYGDKLPTEIRSAVQAAGRFAAGGEMHVLASKNFIKLMALKMKHPSFYEEKEWRIVVQDPPVAEMEFRPGPSNVKPYVALRPASQVTQIRLPLKRVVFGPTLRDDDELKDTIGLMLARYGYQDVLVAPAGIPFGL
jgi:hypothetical protein